jgi:hypothetical protein
MFVYVGWLGCRFNKINSIFLNYENKKLVETGLINTKFFISYLSNADSLGPSG